MIVGRLAERLDGDVEPVIQKVLILRYTTRDALRKEEIADTGVLKILEISAPIAMRKSKGSVDIILKSIDCFCWGVQPFHLARMKEKRAAVIER